MYGTVARMKLKPGSADKMKAVTQQYENLAIAGHVNTLVFQTDNDADEIYLIAIFDSKESYRANADDPAQDARFRQMSELLAAEPEWHDGEIIYEMK